MLAWGVNHRPIRCSRFYAGNTCTEGQIAIFEGWIKKYIASGEAVIIDKVSGFAGISLMLLVSMFACMCVYVFMYVLPIFLCLHYLILECIYILQGIKCKKRIKGSWR